ncbi:CU044_5270 family protein [Actinomadura sp. ATCC 31491]|uniref:CU044_5270 family protein n=1 Tax=Actinomadura luzonensis TaxID=2805427 RepID=A0ABT0FMD9_9ACTN|nr:CU044_5270 family protein [Actinomadura luzonensis]MCK2213442.1 CU044_5270 family protein [Actinomadura luzonensis]
MTLETAEIDDAELIRRSVGDPEQFAALFDAYDLAVPLARPRLYGIATTLVARHRRQEERLLRALARTGVDPLPEPIADTVVRRVAAQDKERELARALASLSRDDRDVLLLVAWEGRDRLLAAARALDAHQEPSRHHKPHLGRHLGRRLALASALAVAIGAGVIVANDRPHAMPVANVRELGERAARAAYDHDYDDRGQAPNPGQWLYVKQLQAPQSADGGYGVDLSRREIGEEWNSVDGLQTAALFPNGKLLVQGNHPGLSAAELARRPVTPEGLLAKIRQKLADMHISWTGTDAPPSMDERLFQAVYQIMGTQALPPEVRAALFRGLATIPGVSVNQNAVDADGRQGVAFSYSDGWTRYDLILDPVDFRFLGTYGVTVRDRTVDHTDSPSQFVKAGTPLTLTALLDTKVVDAPGRK